MWRSSTVCTSQKTSDRASRGQIWLVEGGGDYTSKGRPGVVLQRDEFSILDSVTVCLLTTNPDSRHAPLFRLAVSPSPNNGLQRASWLMLDKLTTVRKHRLRQRIGHLDNRDLDLLVRQVPTVLSCD